MRNNLILSKAIMNRLVAVFILVALSGITQGYARQYKALFIGNSYIYVNNLPQIIADMATAGGDQLIINSSAPGGHSLAQHTVNTTTLSLIAQGGWDYVIIQEQSQRPSFPDADVINGVYPYARKLDSIVKLSNPCAKTVFYMTWGRKNGDPDNCGFFPPLCTYEGMDSMLHLRYSIMADSNNALISPVSRVWRNLRTSQPGMELYDADMSHPSPKGSFAAACAFYTVMFKKDPAQNTYNFSLSAGDAGIIKSAAKKVVYDSLAYWQRYYPNTKAGYSNTTVGSTVMLTNTSVNADSFKWYFGDGDSSSLKSTLHNYKKNGAYKLMLVAKRCGDTDTMSKTITLTTVGITDVIGTGNISIYPNPAVDIISIEGIAKGGHIQITDLTGRIVYQGETTGERQMADISALAAGHYIMQFADNEGNKKAAKLFMKK